MQTIDIVGAGGIGCALGYALRAAGAAVRFVEADAKKIDAGRESGVAVDRRPPLHAPFVSFTDWTPSADSLVLLCTKCYDNAAVLERLPRTATLVPVQNGFDPALEAWGHELEGIASFVSECAPHRPHTRITRRGKLHLGYRGKVCPPSPPQSRGRGGENAPSPQPSPPRGEGEEDFPPQGLRKGVLHALAALLRRARLFRVEVVADVVPFKYTKLMYNAAVSPLAAAAGIDNGDLLADATARRLFFALLRENHRILSAAGIELGKVGPFHPATVARILARPWLARALAWAFTPSLRGTYCSMAPDLPRGRTEIDYYNQRLIDLAGDEPCPLNRAVVGLIKRMERDRIPPHRRVLRELAGNNL